MRRVVQAVVLAGALVLTSGCALIDRAGAAAVVDGARYTDTQLATDLRTWIRRWASKTARGRWKK